MSATSYWSGIFERRLTRRRAMTVVGAAGMSAALLAACGGGSSSSGSKAKPSELVTEAADTTKQARRGGTLKWYQQGDPSSLDSAQANTVAEGIRGLSYEQLLYEKPGFLKPPDLEPAGMVAESWEWSPDLLQLTLKLRQGVKWHNKPPVNGRPLDVQDVLFSWDRLVRVGGSRSGWANSVNPDAPILSVASTDAQTVTIKLKQPLSYLLSMLSYSVGGNFHIVPKETDSTFDNRADVIGTGPFVMTNYSPSVSFTFKRNPDFYEKDQPYVDQIDLPIIAEYATALAQFKAGNIWNYPVAQQDVLTLKRETPALNLFQDYFSQTNISRTNFGSLPGSPFLDERVRQAYSMSLDRDAWIDVVHNVSAFQAEGLPVETRWHSCFVSPQKSWALDPRTKEFGPSAKYFEHNVAEAKKLLAAAGFANGLDVLSTIPAGTAYGVDYPKQVQIIEGMAADAGFRTTQKQIDYTSDYIPRIRDGKGRFDGWTHKRGAGVAWDSLAILVNDLHSKKGQNFFGFDAAGKGDQSGDPQVDSMLEKAMAEIDPNKRKSLLFDLQRYMAQKMYLVVWPGEATGFLMAWPAVSNFNVYRGGTGRRAPFYWWVDDSQSPLKKA